MAYFPSGNFVVTWRSDDNDIYAKIFDTEGVNTTGSFRVNDYTDGSQNRPFAADLPSGGGISWLSSGQDGDGNGIYAQLFDNNGEKIGPEFLVNDDIQEDQQYPAIAVHNDGAMVITWTDNTQKKVFFQRFVPCPDGIDLLEENLLNALSGTQHNLTRRVNHAEDNLDDALLDVQHNLIAIVDTLLAQNDRILEKQGEGTFVNFEIHPLTTMTVSDDGELVGIAMQLDREDRPLIAYMEDKALKLLRCGNPTCTAGNDNMTLDPTGSKPSLQLTSDNLPVIAYADYQQLKLTVCHNPNCTQRNSSTLSITGQFSALSMQLSTQDHPVIAYISSDTADLYLLVCQDHFCAQNNLYYTLEYGTETQYEVSLQLTEADHPILSYYEAFPSFDLKIIRSSTPTCTEAEYTTFDTDGFVGIGTSLQLTAEGSPVISYLKLDDASLKVANALTLFDRLVSVKASILDGQEERLAALQTTLGTLVTAKFQRSARRPHPGHQLQQNISTQIDELGEDITRQQQAIKAHVVSNITVLRAAVVQNFSEILDQQARLNESLQGLARQVTQVEGKVDLLLHLFSQTFLRNETAAPTVAPTHFPTAGPSLAPIPNPTALPTSYPTPIPLDFARPKKSFPSAEKDAARAVGLASSSGGGLLVTLLLLWRVA